MYNHTQELTLKRVNEALSFAHYCAPATKAGLLSLQDWALTGAEFTERQHKLAYHLWRQTLDAVSQLKDIPPPATIDQLTIEQLAKEVVALKSEVKRLNEDMRKLTELTINLEYRIEDVEGMPV